MLIPIREAHRQQLKITIVVLFLWPLYLAVYFSLRHRERLLSKVERHLVFLAGHVFSCPTFWSRLNAIEKKKCKFSPECWWKWKEKRKSYIYTFRYIHQLWWFDLVVLPEHTADFFLDILSANLNVKWELKCCVYFFITIQLTLFLLTLMTSLLFFLDLFTLNRWIAA